MPKPMKPMVMMRKPAPEWPFGGRAGMLTSLFMTWVLGPIGFLIGGPLALLMFSMSELAPRDDVKGILATLGVAYGLMAVLGWWAGIGTVLGFGLFIWVFMQSRGWVFAH